MKPPARFVLHEHRTRPATAREVEDYLAAILGRPLWAQRVVIPARLTIEGTLGDDDQALGCYRDDLPAIDTTKAHVGNRDEQAIVRGGFPLVLADWLLTVCDPMRDLLDHRLEAAFPSLPLYLLYHQLSDLAAFLQTLDSENQTTQKLIENANKARGAMEGVPIHIPLSRLEEAAQRLGYREGLENVDYFALACHNASMVGISSIWTHPSIPFPSPSPADSWQRTAAWIVTKHTMPNWTARCAW